MPARIGHGPFACGWWPLWPWKQLFYNTRWGDKGPGMHPWQSRSPSSEVRTENVWCKSQARYAPALGRSPFTQQQCMPCGQLRTARRVRIVWLAGITPAGRAGGPPAPDFLSLMQCVPYVCRPDLQKSKTRPPEWKKLRSEWRFFQALFCYRKLATGMRL